jgi:hypothetical protein
MPAMLDVILGWVHRSQLDRFCVKTWAYLRAGVHYSQPLSGRSFVPEATGQECLQVDMRRFRKEESERRGTDPISTSPPKQTPSAPFHLLEPLRLPSFLAVQKLRCTHHSDILKVPPYGVPIHSLASPPRYCHVILCKHATDVPALKRTDLDVPCYQSTVTS